MSSIYSIHTFKYAYQCLVFCSVRQDPPQTRNWYVLDERNCRLLTFKSRDAAKQKQPDGHIDLTHVLFTYISSISNV